MEISPQKQEEFKLLFQEFVNTYPHTSKGIKHTRSYSQQRESGQRNYNAIAEAKELGEDTSDRILLQLLPYQDTQNNCQKGAWIHNAPAIIKDLKTWFENKGWTKPEDWSKVAEIIFYFVSNCVENPDSLAIYCQDFQRAQYSKGLQTGFMTPILNALKPDDFILINNKSRVVINYFLETKYSQKLIDYSAINKNGRKLINDISHVIERFNLPALRQEDLFDMFCHWLVAEKKYDFKSSKSKSDRVTESNLEELNMKEENTTPEIHPDCYFNEEAFLVLQSIDNDESNKIYLVSQYRIRKAFIKMCEEVAHNIPFNIKSKLSLTGGYVEPEFYNINYDINSELNFPLFALKISFYINLYTNSLDFGVYIDTDSNYDLLKNIFVKSILFVKNQYQHLSLEYLNRIGHTYRSTLEDNQLFLERLYTDTDSINYSELTFGV